MKYLIITTCIAYAASAVFVSSISTQKKLNKTEVSDFNLLPISERLGLLLLSTLEIKEYPKFSRESLLASIPNMPNIDFFFVDVRSLLTQSLKVEEGIPLPEIDWSYLLNLCILPEFCYNDTITITSGKTKMIGQQQTTSGNEVSPTSFKNWFHVPLFMWHSPEFLLNVTDNTNGDQFLSSDIFFTISDLTLNTSFNYVHVPDVGIQISNLTIDFSVDYLRANIENITTIYRNGSVEIGSPFKGDFTEFFEQDWKGFKDGYHKFIESWTNCFLSGSSNDNCEDVGSPETKQFDTMNLLQLIQTIGLGSLQTLK